MLNETASSIEDRPAQRSTTRYTNGDAQHTELREMVMNVLSIERETFEEDKLPKDHLLMVGQDSRLLATFEGRLLHRLGGGLRSVGSAACAGQSAAAVPRGRRQARRLCGRGAGHPKPRPWWPNALLFLITLFSVLLVGTDMAINEIANGDVAAAAPYIDNLLLESVARAALRHRHSADPRRARAGTLFRRTPS